MPNTERRRSIAELLRFGPSQRFEFQPDEHRLLIDGKPAPLGRRALDLLKVLAERPDHLISKSDLLDLVWPGLVVEEANLQMQISNLRKVLGGDVITTVPGRGYRFTAAVSRVPTSTASSPTAPPAQVPAPAYSVAVPVGAPRLIGRDLDLARIRGLLQAGGSVSLVGSSGVGKTTLARAVAAGWHGRSVWVDLAALTGGHQVAGAIARALGLQLMGDDGAAPAQLLAALRDQNLLLVLDNAEHLIQEAHWRCWWNASAPPITASSSRPNRCRRCAPCARSSTACRWRWRWRPRGCHCWACKGCTTRWRSASHCSRAAIAMRRRATARCTTRSTGATACWVRPINVCSGHLACSPGVSPSTSPWP